MHPYFVFIPDLDSWRQQRVTAACHAFLTKVDPEFESKSLDLDGTHVGSFFCMSTDEARRLLIVFFKALLGRVGKEEANGDAFGLGRADAAAALARRAKGGTMMMELLCTCGATVGDLLEEYRAWTGERMRFEKLWPGDLRGEYGWYMLHLTPGQAQVVASRYSSVIRFVDDAAPIDES